MRYLLVFILLLGSAKAQDYKILKENLSPKVKLYWDAQKKHLQGTGAYYVGVVKPTVDEKHGKWLFYSYDGILEEEANYYRNRLHGKRTFYYPNKQIKEEAYFTFNVPDSTYKTFAEDGKLLTKGQFDLGSPVGRWEYYYADGSPKSVEVVSNDTIYLMEFWEEQMPHKQTIKNGNGKILSYYVDGVVKESYTFQNGLKTGPFEERTANGVLSVAGGFVNGKKDGVWEFYSYNAVLEKRVGYTTDSLDGVYLVMLSEKDTLTFGNYNNGKKTGRWIWHNDNATLDMEGYFVEGKQDSIWHYYFPNGQLSYVAKFQKDLRTGDWTYYYPNGALYRKGSYVNDLKNGEWQTWYEDSTLLMSGRYENGLEEGEWKNYWENGRLKNKSSFRSGKLNGAWISYTPDGVLSLKGNYKDGLKEGEWLLFYSNGRLKEKQHYKIMAQKNISEGLNKMGYKELTSELHGSFEAYSQIDYQIKEIGKYKNGQKHGTWINYYPGGVVPTILAQYQNGQLDGIFKQFDRYGHLVYEINYKNGLKHGEFIAFNENGKIVSRKVFRYGRQIENREREGFIPER